MADLANFNVTAASETGADLVILSPVERKPTDIVITLLGPDSRRAREATREMTDQLTKEAFERKTAPTDETYERMAAMHAAGITKGWSNLQMDGADLPFSTENAIRLYTEHRWLREQVEGFAGKRANFFTE